MIYILIFSGPYQPPSHRSELHNPELHDPHESYRQRRHAQNPNTSRQHKQADSRTFPRTTVQSSKQQSAPLAVITSANMSPDCESIPDAQCLYNGDSSDKHHDEQHKAEDDLENSSLTCSYLTSHILGSKNLESETKEETFEGSFEMSTIHCEGEQTLNDSNREDFKLVLSQDSETEGRLLLLVLVTVLYSITYYTNNVEHNQHITSIIL